MVLLVLLWTCATTALRLNGYEPSAINNKFTVNRIQRTSAEEEAANSEDSELQYTSNVVALTQKDATSLSSVYVQAMRGDAGISRAANATAPLISVNGGQVFLADVTVGGQKFSTVIDSGSSDPWLVVPGWKCFDPVDDTPLTQADCGFASQYDSTRSTTYTAVADQNFNISYADGEYLNGAIGMESFTMGGITVPQQQFGLVNVAAWYGDGVSTGLIGFAGRTLTSAFAGTNPQADGGTTNRPLYYNPLFVNMYQQQNIPAIFSMAIDRNQSVGGVLALGGIPDIQHSPYFASTPIAGLSVNSTGTAVYTFYTIYVDGYAYSANRSTQFNSYNNVNRFKTPLTHNGSDTIVDSGTSLAYVPQDVIDATALLYNPPAYYDDQAGAYLVDCNSQPPVFGVGIGKKIFYVNALDMIVTIAPDYCVTGIQSDGGGLSILGGTFMKNVLAVFDIQGGKMRFAARQYYKLYGKGI